MTEPAITPELSQNRSEGTHLGSGGEPLPGSDDGKRIFEGIFAAFKDRTVATVA